MKKALKIIFSIVFIAAIYLELCLIFVPKDISDFGGEEYYRAQSFKTEEKNSLDVMAFGHSSVYSGFIPATMFEEYGITSYASSVPRQSIKSINKLLKDACKQQKLKVAILDVDCLYNGNDSSNFSILLAPFRYHYRWKTLKFRDFYTLPKVQNNDINKGYYFSNHIQQFNLTNYMGKETMKEEKISRKNLHQLNKFIDICNHNNVKVVLMTFPNVLSWNYGRHNFIKNYAAQQNVPFVDLNVIKYNIDFNNDFRDKGDHLNVYGALKTTSFLGQYLKENYHDLLVDHRGEKRFAKWQKVIKHFHDLKNGTRTN